MPTRLATFIMIILLLSACMTQADKHQQADALLEQLHQAIQQQHWDQVEKLYGPKFFRHQSKASWRQGMQSLQQSLGRISAFNIVSKSKDPRYSGDFYIYIITVQHEHGFSKETVTIFEGLDDDELSIVGHQIKPRSNP